MRVRFLGLEDPLEEGMATHSCLENPMDREAWLAAVHRIAKNQIQLSEHSPHSLAVLGGRDANN